MARKSRHDKLVDDAIKSGNWGGAASASKCDLQKSGAVLRAGKKPVDHFGAADIPPDEEPSETDNQGESDPDLAIDDIEADQPVETLRDAYEYLNYQQWVPQTEPQSERYPFKLRTEWEALPRMERRRLLRRPVEARDPRWSYYGLPRPEMSRSKARAFLRSATLDNKRSQHNAPLPPELAVRTTAKQWERYRLSQYTTALEQPRKLLVEAPQGVTPPAAVVALERKSNLTGDERADFYRRAFGKPPENLRLGMSPSVPQRRTPASPRLRVSKDELRKQAEAALATEHPITVCPTYYGYDPMKRRRGRPRKPKLRLIRSNGRPRLGTEALPAAVRAQRYRDKKKALRLVAGVTRVHFTPRLQAWMWAHLNAETLALCNMRKAA